MGRPLPNVRGAGGAVACLVLAASAAGCFGASYERDRAFRLEPFLDDLNDPLYLTHAGDGSGRLFIVEQDGAILVWDDRLLATPFLDISSLVKSGGEQGVLGLAFHPGYAAGPNAGRFFVHYTDNAGDTVLAEYSVSVTDPNRANPASARIMLHVDDPYSNHNGGMVAFGPDGYLYLALGDGGSGGDPQGNGQNLETLLGKILRLDVDNPIGALPGALGYTIPPNNPFVGRAGRDEIWAYGLRNPWRFSFDAANGDLWIGDVGQKEWEEIDLEPAGTKGGRNYGWNAYEGSHRFKDGVTAPDAVMPVAEYSNTDSNNCAVTGGYFYRGRDVPDLQGAYVFADYCAGTLWTLRNDGTSWVQREARDTSLMISSFGEDEEGELYVIDHAGGVFKVVA